MEMQRNCENLNKKIFVGVGAYDIPELWSERFEECPFAGFNYAATCPKAERSHTGIHFFLNDYQFQRLWTMPDYYIPLLRQFKCVMSPDFSLYADWPRAVQIFNHYRKHWLGAYFQMHGIKVIPTISWSDEESFNWCFDGEPTHGTVAVSSVGTQMNKHSREMFMKGCREMVRRLHPEQIIFYGEIPKECEYTNEVVRLVPFQERFRKAGKDGSE